MAQLAVSSMMMISAVFGQAPPTLSIGNYQLVGEQRATRSEWYATYRAELTNTGGARGPVTARLRSVVPAIQVIPGQDLLHFPAVPANGRVSSIDTFTVKIDRTVATNFTTDLLWSFDNPVANAGQNQTVRVGTTVLLNGSSSSNPAAAGVLTYEWEFASRPANSRAALTNATTVNPSFTVDVPGTYVVTLTVRNGSGVDRSQVTISTVNSPPVANAGPNQTVAVGSTVTLNGSGSYDVDGDSLMFNWSFISRPSGSLAVLSNTRVVSPTFVVDKPGTYIVQLIVNDGTVDSAPSTVTISTTNTPPVANAGQNQTVAVGVVVQLNGAGSTDIDGDPLTYKWSFISVPSGSTATLSSTTAVNPTFTVDRAGTYVVQLIVNDGKIDSAPATVTISTITIQPPTAVCGPNQTVLHGTTVTLSATCTDPQGLPLTYLWSLITRPAGSTATLSSTTAVSPTFVADKPGIFVAQLIVSNGTVSSQPCTTTITTTNAAPVANAGPNQTVSVGATVTLDGGGSYDPDQDPLTYSWSLLSRPSQSLAMLSGANSKNPTFIADEPGTYVAQLIVSDGFVSSAPATVTITAVAMKITLSPNPLNLLVTVPGTLNVTLGTVAGNGGVIVSLTFDPAVVSMPSTVTIPSGATSVNVPVTPVAVGSSGVLATSPGYLAGTATINVTTPSISLTLPSGIGLTRTVNGTVTLSAPAPAGGVNVALTSNPAGIVTFNPTTVAILTGNSTGTFTATGAVEGSATVTAAAPGYASGTASVLVAKLGGISVPSNVTVAPGASAPLNISLTTPAPSGGTTVNLVSSDTSIVTVTSSVFIPQGSTTPATAPQVTGVSFGSATITASSPGYVGDSQTVTVTITLTLSPQAVTVGVGGAKSINLLLSAPAPTGGLTINLNSSNTGVATVPTSVIVPQGTTTAQFTVTSVAPGTATITAQAASPVVQPATATVNSVIFGALGVPANTTVGLGQSVPFPITLSAAAAEAVTVNLVSGNTSRVTISPASVTIAAGQTQPAQQPQVTGVGLGAATITASANGYGTASGSVQTTATLSFSPSTLTLAGTETKTTNVVLSAPAPNGGLTVNLSASPAGIVTIPASVTIAGGATQAQVSVQGVSGGTATITASAADVTSGTATVTVQSAGAIGLPSGVTLTPGQSAPFPVTLPTPAPADTTVTLSSNDPSKVTIAPASVVVLSGQTQPATQPQVTGVSFGSASITASAPGYTSSSQQVTVAGSLSFSPQTLSLSGTETKTLTLTLSAPAPAGGLNVTLAASPAGVVTIAGTTTIAAGTTTANVSVTGAALGTTTITASTATPNVTSATATATVSSPGSLSLPSGVTVGLGQSTAMQVTLPAPAPPGGVTVTLTSSDTSILTISPGTVTINAGQTQPSTAPQVTGVRPGNATITAAAPTYTSASQPVQVTATITFSPSSLTIPGTETRNLTLTLSGPAPAGGMVFNISSSATGVATVPSTVTIPAGQTTVTVPVTGVTPGTAVVRAQAPNLTDATANVTVTTPSDIIVPATLNLSPGDSSGLPISLSRAESTNVFLEVTSNDPSKVTVTEPTVMIPAGQTQPSSNRVSITGVGLGTAILTVRATNITLTPATTTVVVAYGVTLTPSNLTIPAPGLDGMLGLTLSAPAPAGGITFTATSTNPSVATVISSIVMNPGWSSLSFPVTAVGPGTTVIRLTSPVTQEVTATVTVEPPGTINLSGPATIVLSQTGTLTVTLSKPAPAGGTTVNLASSDTHKVSVTPTSVTIPAGATQPAAQPQLTAVNVGTATITATATAYTAASPLTVNVNATLTWVTPTLTIVGVGSQGDLYLRLNAMPSMDGVFVNLSSSNPAVATIQSTAVFIWDGSTTPSIVIPVTATGIGTATIRASGVNIPEVTATVTVVGQMTITTASLPDGVVGGAYNATLAVAGGTGPYTWSATGLPANLTINPGTGQITGTPTAAGTSNVTVTVTDSLTPTPRTATKAFTLRVNPPGLTITTESLPAGAVGAAYNASVAAAGGTTPYTWQATGLPAGLTMNAGTGQITGTPTAAGTNNVTVTVTDSSAPTPQTASKTFVLNIATGLAITTTSLPNGAVGDAYNATVAAVGGTTPYTWSATGLPANLTINPNTGQITGTPTATGTSTVTVTVTDATLPTPLTATKTLSLTVSSALIGATLTPSNLTIAGPALQGSLTLTLSVPAPAGGIDFTATSTNPSVATVAPTVVMNPGWSSLSFPVTAVAPGTTVIRLTSPVTQEVTATVTVEPPGTINLSGPATIVLSQTGTLTVTLSKPAPAGGTTVNLASSDTHILTVTPISVMIPAGATQPAAQPQLTAVNVGTATITATATAYTAASPLTVNVNATLTWVTPTLTIVGVGGQGDLYLRLNAMPSMDGVFVNLSSSNPAVATVQSTAVFIWDGSTTPSIVIPVTATGIGTATIRASGVNIPEVTATVTVVGQMTITTASLPDGVVGGAYNATLAVAGGTGPYTWSATGLPANLTINPGTGQITGTPTAAGTSTVTVTVTDSSSPTPRSASKTFSLAINSAGITITTASLPNGTVGVAYNATVAATGGATPYTWSAIGLPANLTVNPGTGQITGTPTAAGTSNVTVTVTDSSSPTPQSASKTFTLTINAAALTITTTSLPNGTAGAAYSAAVAATGGTTPYTWSAAGLPANLTINPSTGQITGTPTAAGTSTVTVTVTDSSSPTPQTASKTLSLTIGAPAELTITTASLPNGTVGTPYSATMAATGGMPPYLWSASRMPPGLSINSSTGQITGTPTDAGTYAASFTVTDANSQTASRNITITVTVPPVTITTASLPSGTATLPYSATVNASGGVPPYQWSASGLPAGLSMNTSTGQITGTVGVPGVSTVTITVQDSSNPAPLSASKTFTLTIASLSPVIDTATLPAGAVGAAYSANVVASGGTPPYTWSAAGLPAGLSINPGTGQITGTPTTVGTSSVTITVNDSAVPSRSGSKTFSLTIAPAPLVISTATLPNGTVGAAYNATVTATGGTPGYMWSATGLPAGLNINPGTGQITGTPTTAGTSTVNVTVTDAGTPTPQTVSKTFTVTIAPALLSITTTTLPNGTAGAAYNATVAAEGGITPYNWSATGLPAGLSINASTGQITGTPTAAGTSTVNVTVTDSGTPTPQTVSKTFTVIIAPAPLVITTTALPNGVTGTVYNATVAASGGTPAYNWSATGLPSGLEINPSTGQITGTPAAAGTVSVTVTVTDSGSPTPQTASKTFSLTILVPLSITTTVLPSGVINVPYSATVNATGGVPPYSWSAAGLPAGLTMNASTGQITGTATAAGAASVTITVTDSSTPTARTATKSLSLVINSGLSVTTPSLPNAISGTAYAAMVEAAGGTQPYSWSATGLPAGLTINANSGVISGIPSTPGTSSVTITVTDSTAPAQSASKTLTLNVVTQLAVTTSSLPTATAGINYSATVAATGGTTPYQWSATGLPAGLTMNASTGEIAGIPTVAGSFPVAITVTDAAAPTPQTATRTLNLVVNPAGLAITTTSLPDGMVGAGYSSAAIATGGIAPYTWSATGLPAGLTISTSTGQITGTPAAAGVSSVTITVQDSSLPTPHTATKTFSLTVVPPPLVITTAMLPNGVVNTPYSVLVQAAGGTAPYTWSAVDLPAGLAINPATGQIAGTPTAVGRVTATITVTDSSSPQLTTSKGLSINIVTALTITTTSLPTGLVGTAYNATVAAAGGVAPYSFSATGLPAGLSIDPATGQITGTASAAGTSSVTITVTDTGTPNPQTANKTFSLVIASPLNITTTSLPSGVRGVPYTATVTASGGVPPYTWAATGLPPGLTINPTTGQISGTPSTVSTSPVLVTVADSSTTPQSVSQTLWITIAAPPLALVTGSLPNGTAWVYYMQTFEAVGGTPPYKWQWKPTDELNGVLPDGLTLETNTGLLAGVPTTPGVYQVTVTVSDLASPPQSVSKDFTLLIGTPTGPTTLTVSNATIGSDLQAPVTIGFSPPPSSEVTLTITSGNPALVLLGTPGATGTASVTTNIAAGTTSVVIYAKALAGSGTTTITASAPGYTNGTGAVTLSPSGFVIAGPNGIGAPFATFQGVTTNMTVYAARLSGGVFAEPQQVRGGLTVNVPVSTTVTSVGTVSSPTVVFSGGMDSGNVQFIASALNTGTTDIVVSAPLGFTTPATGATVTATVQPSGILGFSATIGKNLQAAVSTSLTAPPSSSVSLLIESLDPAKLKFATTPTAAGSTSITVIQPAGQIGSPVFYAQALDSSGTARYRVSASGYGSLESTVTLAPSGVVIKSPFGIGANFSMTVGVGNASLEIYTARLDGSGNYVESQAVAGGMSVSATVTSSNPSVGVITVSPVTISAGSNMATTEFQPLANGTSTLTASATGYTPAVQGTITATVASSSFLLTGGITIGKYLQYEGTVVLPYRTSSSPAIDVTLQSNSPSLKLAKQATDAGSSSITLTIPAGGNSATYYMQAFDSTGSATYTGTAPGYASANATVYFGPSGVVVFATTPVSLAGGPKPVTVLAALLDSVTMAPLESMPVAGGLAPVVAGLSSSNPAVGTVPATASIAPAQDSGTVNFTPLATGSTVISVTQPPGWTTPNAFVSQTVQVNP